MLPQLGQHDVIHHEKVGFNKATLIVQNDHVQLQGLLALILRRMLFRDSLGHHFEDEFNIADIPLRCHIGYLEKFMMPTT